MKKTINVMLAAVLFAIPILKTNASSSKAHSNVAITGELKKWHAVTLTFDGPEVSETDEYHPFFNYRSDVTFSHKKTGKKYKVPGYFAADGYAGTTSAASSTISSDSPRRTRTTGKGSAP